MSFNDVSKVLDDDDLKNFDYYQEFSALLMERRLYWFFYTNIDISCERLNRNRYFKYRGTFHLFDFFLPEGCKKLNIQRNTYVEFKRCLISNTLLDLQQVAKCKKNSNFILIYNSQGCVGSTVIDDVNKHGLIKVFQFDDFFLERQKIPQDKLPYLDDFRPEFPWPNERKEIIKKAQNAFQSEKISFFIGAGVSHSAGGPLWGQLLQDVIVRSRCVTEYERDDVDNIANNIKSSIIMGRFAIHQFMRPYRRLPDFLRDEVLYINIKPSKTIEEIVRICLRFNNVESIITYNYDDLIEQEFQRQTSGCDSMCVPKYKKNCILCNHIPIYHVHGFIPHEKSIGYSEDIVLGETEYHALYKESFHWSNVEQLHALYRTSCIFIGLSMDDPNLRRLLDISFSDSDGDPRHYVFMQRPHIEFAKNTESKNLKYCHRLEDMMSQMGVNIIWYEEHDEIPDLLKQITQRNIKN